MTPFSTFVRVFVVIAILITSAPNAQDGWLGVADDLSGNECTNYIGEMQALVSKEQSDKGSPLREFLERELRDSGFDDVVAEDGSSTSGGTPGEPVYATWHPRAAAIYEAGSRTPVLSLQAAPALVAIGSQSARYSSIPVIDVGSGVRDDDYALRSVRGGLVLAWGPIEEVYRQAVTGKQALGVLSYLQNEIDLGILRPDQIPQQSLASLGSSGVRAGTFAMTVTEEVANRWRRHAQLDQPVHVDVRVDVEYPSDCGEAVWARLDASRSTIPRHRGDIVLLFTEIPGRGCAGASAVGPAAVLLDIARVCMSLHREGRLALERSVVFLWTSNPPAIRSLIAEQQWDIAAAWGLTAVGADLCGDASICVIGPPISHVSWPSSWTDWVAGRVYARAHQAVSAVDREDPVRLVPYCRASDPYLLNGPSASFSTMYVTGKTLTPSPEKAAASTGDEGSVSLIEQTVLASSLPTVEGRVPEPSMVEQVCRDLGLRLEARLASTESHLRGGAEASGDLESALRQSHCQMVGARAEVDAYLSAWRKEIPGLDMSSLTTQMDSLLLACEARCAGLIPLTGRHADQGDLVVSPSPREEDAAKRATRSRLPTRSPEVIGRSLVFEGRSPVVLIPDEVDPEVAFQTVARLGHSKSTLAIAQELGSIFGTEEMDAVDTLSRIAEQRGAVEVFSPERIVTSVALSPRAMSVVAGRAAPSGSSPSVIATSGSGLEDTTASAAGARPTEREDRNKEAEAHHPGVALQDSGRSQDAQASEKERLRQRQEAEEALRVGIAHYTERRYREALSSLRKVGKSTPESYRQAQRLIPEIEMAIRAEETRSKEASAGGCTDLGVLRATKAEGDGREVSGSLELHQQMTYCFTVEGPGYGDLEVLVPTGFGVEGAGVALTGIKAFKDTDAMFARYAADMIPTGTHMTIAITNKRAEKPAFDCLIYFYPR